MPFTKLDINNKINKKKLESKTFEKTYNFTSLLALK